MGYVFPILMAFFLWNFPAGLWLYYFLTTIFQVGQQYVVNLELARAEAPTAAAGGGPEADNEDQGGGSGDGERQSGD
jgi:membrane protein insertase Oxa1/YidC/SpoIIIJ